MQPSRLVTSPVHSSSHMAQWVRHSQTPTGVNLSSFLSLLKGKISIPRDREAARYSERSMGFVNVAHLSLEPPAAA